MCVCVCEFATLTERQASLSRTTNKKAETYSAALGHKQTPYYSENGYHKIIPYFFNDIICLYNQKKSFCLSLPFFSQYCLSQV